MLKWREEKGEVATGRRKERREELLGMMLEETSLLRAREEAIDSLMLNLGSKTGRFIVFVLFCFSSF